MSSELNRSRRPAVTTAQSAGPEPRIGHVHLKVADLDRSLAFYCGVLGFQVTQYLNPQAALISMGGGYHHHLALNTWDSLGGLPPPKGSTGLYHFAIDYPSRDGLIDAARRIVAAGLAPEHATDHGISEAVYVRDPDGIVVELSWDRPMEDWPRTATGELAAGNAKLDLADLLGAGEHIA